LLEQLPGLVEIFIKDHQPHRHEQAADQSPHRVVACIEQH
jgi:hypothetical protein